MITERQNPAFWELIYIGKNWLSVLGFVLSVISTVHLYGELYYSEIRLESFVMVHD